MRPRHPCRARRDRRRQPTRDRWPSTPCTPASASRPASSSSARSGPARRPPSSAPAAKRPVSRPGCRAQAAPDCIVIADRTRQLLGEEFELESLGALELKGFEAPVQAWQVLRERRTASRFEAIHTQQLSQLVGRDSELALLLERWNTACEGEGQIVLLSGEPGIGKSRITQAAAGTHGRRRPRDDGAAMLALPQQQRPLSAGALPRDRRGPGAGRCAGPARRALRAVPGRPRRLARARSAGLPAPADDAARWRPAGPGRPDAAAAESRDLAGRHRRHARPFADARRCSCSSKTRTGSTRPPRNGSAWPSTACATPAC